MTGVETREVPAPEPVLRIRDLRIRFRTPGRRTGEPVAPIGPPVAVCLAVMSASDSGSKSPTLLLAGLAWPSSQTTASSGISQILAARAHSFLIASRAASTV